MSYIKARDEAELAENQARAAYSHTDERSHEYLAQAIAHLAAAVREIALELHRNQ